MTKVYLVCCGLGRIHRGFESFTQECYEALAGHPALDLTVFKGGGQTSAGQVGLPCLRREVPAVARLGAAIGKTGYWLEQVSFALSLIPQVAKGKPDVVCFMDCNVGNVLWHWRRVSGGRFKIILSNGGPLRPPFPRWDFVQQLTPAHAAQALAAGQDPEKQGVIPYGIAIDAIDRTAGPMSPAARVELRARLGLPTDRPLVLSVGAVNSSHKRMDYLVSELAALPHPRPFLVMLGQADEETPSVRALADRLLGPEGFAIRTVPHAEVDGYYLAADVFVLASLKEGFGRVFLEALGAGLPCLAHDYEVSRFVLGKDGMLGDFTQAGSLTRLLGAALAGDGPAARVCRQTRVRERFGWDSLTPQYVAMFQQCARGNP